MPLLFVSCSRCRLSLYVAATVAWSAVIGCGSPPDSQGPRGDVTMTIQYNGEPVAVGGVDLINVEQGDGGGGELSADGTVTIANVATGKYTVVVRPPEPDPTPDQSTVDAGKDYSNIPAKFRSAQTSPLTIDVAEGPNEFQFDLGGAN